VRGKPGLPVERDLYFDAVKLLFAYVAAHADPGSLKRVTAQRKYGRLDMLVD